MENEIMVSVLCLAYNHEKYIRQCLDGFVTQKTNFKFEVLINDDASTDNTAKIIKEYEEKYPDIIKPTYQTENQYSKGVKISSRVLLPKAKGRYIAFCEGDDFWCDENKLQKQFDALERHPDCSFCCHRTNKVNRNGEYIEGLFPSSDLETQIIESYCFLDKVINHGFWAQTSSHFIKKEVFVENVDFIVKYSKSLGFGDYVQMFFSAYSGNIYYVDEIMSTYRVCSEGSWTSSHSLVPRVKKAEMISSQIDFIDFFDEYTGKNFHDILEISKTSKMVSKLWFEGKYRELRKPKYKGQIKTFSYRHRFIMFVGAIFPRLVSAIVNCLDRRRIVRAKNKLGS